MIFKKKKKNGNGSNVAPSLPDTSVYRWGQWAIPSERSLNLTNT